LCAPSLPAGVVVHGAKQHKIANPITNAKSVTLNSVFIAPQSTPIHRPLSGLAAAIEVFFLSGQEVLWKTSPSEIRERDGFRKQTAI